MGVTTSRCEDAPEAAEHVEDAPAEEPAVKVEAEQGGEEGEEKEAGEAEDAEEAEEDEEPKFEVVVATAPHDPRFPSTNQARHCYTRYNEFYRCKSQKGEEDPQCEFYKKAYRSLCPNDWVERWEEAREGGSWAGKY